VCPVPLARLRQHLARGEYVQARREAERLIQTGDLAGADRVHAYRGAALAHYSLQGVFAAVKLGEVALGLAQKLSDGELSARLRVELAEFYLALGDTHMAREHLFRCEEEPATCGPQPALKARLKQDRGQMHRLRKEYDEAAASLLEAADLYGREGSHRQALEALRAVVASYLEGGRPGLAWPVLERVSACLQEHPDEELSALHVTDLAHYYRLVGDLRVSMNFCEEALIPGRPGVDDRVLATASAIAGANALDLGSRQEAQSFAELAMEYAIRSKLPHLMNQASALRARLQQDEGKG